MPPLDFDVLDSADTSIGTIYLCRRDVEDKPAEPIFEIRIDGALLMSSVNPVSERQLSTSALAMHPEGTALRVLVGGLGLGYTADAALASPRVAHVRVVDKMDFVIDWLRRHLLPLADALTDRQRVELVRGDIYADLLGPAAQTYDLILVDVDHSPDGLLDSASAPFYTPEGQRRVAAHLAPGGVLGVWSASDSDDFADVLSEVYPASVREHVRWENALPNGGKEEFHNVLFLGRAALGQA